MATFWERVLAVGHRLRFRRERSLSPQQNQARWKAVYQDWAALANGLGQVGEVQTRMTNRLEQAYDVWQRLEGQYASLLEGAMEVVDYCERLDPPPEEIPAVRRKLLSLLDEHGAAPWSPAVGEPVPEGCEVMAVVPSKDLAPGTVKTVARRGYRRDGMILRSPVVTVTASSPTEPAVEGVEGEEDHLPEVSPETQHQEPASDTSTTPANGQEENNEHASHRD